MPKLKNARHESPQPRETATPERILRSAGEYEISDTGIVIFFDSPIWQLVKDKTLDERQFTVARRFLDIWVRAGLEPGPRSIDWQRVYAPDPFAFPLMPATRFAAEAREEYRAIQRDLGMQRAWLVEAVVCRDRPWLDVAGVVTEDRSPRLRIEKAKKALCCCLNELGDRWGLTR